MITPEYVAPARFVLTVLHVKDPAAPSRPGNPGQEAAEGSTRCGLLLLASELWQMVEREPGDRVCERCLGEDLSEEQGSLL